jgi:hypothetical protein
VGEYFVSPPNRNSCNCKPAIGDEVWVRARVLECGEGDDCVEVWVDDKFSEEDTNLLIPKRDIRKEAP